MANIRGAPPDPRQLEEEASKLPSVVDDLVVKLVILRYAFSNYVQWYVGPGTAWAFLNRWIPALARQLSVSWEDKDDITHARELREEFGSPVPLKVLLKVVRWVQVNFYQLDEFVNVAIAIARYRNALVVHYLTCAPDFFLPILGALQWAKVLELAGKHLLLFEKPFGAGLESCKTLMDRAQEVFGEWFRAIDHWGFKGPIVRLPEAGLNDNQRDHLVTLYVKNWETKASGGRPYFDSRSVNGLQRDFISHVWVLVAEFLRRAGTTLEDVEAARLEVLQSVKVLYSRKDIAKHTYCAQYAGYKGEPQVRENTNAQTYFVWELELTLPHINRGRPIRVVIEVGKAMPEKVGLVRAEFAPKSGLEPFIYDFQTPGENDVPEHARMLSEAYQLMVHFGMAEPVELAEEAIVQDETFHFVHRKFAEGTWAAMGNVAPYWDEVEALDTYEPGEGRPAKAQELFFQNVVDW